MKIHGEVFARSLIKRAIVIVFTWNVVLLCLFGTFVAFAIFIGIFAAAATSGEPAAVTTYAPVYGEGEHQLLSVKIDGVIMGSEQGAPSFFSSLDGQTAGYTVKDQLYTAAHDPLIKGVILEIDSPGGTIYGARAIADGVQYYRETAKKPIYAHISGMGASGGYWAAVSADKVLMDYGSDAGSIGVIMGPFQYFDKVTAIDGGLLGGGIITQNGIENTYLTAGKYKDTGNPFRKMTPDELALLQQAVNNEYDEFVRYVSERRAIPEATIRNQIGAMIYGNKTAAELKLIDGSANRHVAYDQLAAAANIKNNYYVSQEEHLPTFFESMLGAITRKPQPQAQKIDLCALSQAKLAYHGDVTAWCQE